jgi:hypothetical protein
MYRIMFLPLIGVFLMGMTVSSNLDISVTEQSQTGACPNGSTYADGCSGAPAGTPQFPKLFSGYATRPPWNVAGVDYYVGIPDNITLKDPTTSPLPSGCAYQTSGPYVHSIYCGNVGNITFQGFDFSAHGGINIMFFGTYGNVLITQNNFAAGTNCLDPFIMAHAGASGGSITAMYNTLDGNGNTTCTNPYYGGMMAGVNTAKWNYIKNIPEDVFVTGSGGGNENPTTMLYNLIDSQGWTPGGHPDGVQWGGGTISNVNFSFNTYRNQNAGQPAAGGVQPVHILAQGGGAQVSPTVSFNTLIFPAPPQDANQVIVCGGDAGDPTTGFQAYGNYIDASGAVTALMKVSACTGATWGAPNDNINLVTGATYTHTP